jgi:hypothetical protein
LKIIINISSSVLAKTGSLSLHSHIAYTQNIRKIKQLKPSAGGRGGFQYRKTFGMLKEKGNIKFEKQSVKTFREAQGRE